jgi:hypothetical protein
MLGGVLKLACFLPFSAIFCAFLCCSSHCHSLYFSQSVTCVVSAVVGRRDFALTTLAVSRFVLTPVPCRCPRSFVSPFAFCSRRLSAPAVKHSVFSLCVCVFSLACEWDFLACSLFGEVLPL